MIPCGKQSENNIEYFKLAYESKMKKYGEEWIFATENKQKQVMREKKDKIRRDLTKGYMALLSAQLGE
ncbi:hypothetical protein ABEV78_12195 [Bacillus licheniformis]|uniref:hypothetical protein n=1 Tax=Bacillus TaxID=1386 RepID=UPI0009B71D73|nr:hypothetical protein [Bacillus licheniformis]ARC67885.1 hypothetical protein B34_00442 [Bacillus licheniformis]MDE1421391.1 hypothetical protein [Bacillus licheniformis]TWL68765.1 hypothetical protein CHCC15318_1507 [Bacillus licheniformis]TWM59983.1 hypothetical protein CHCC14813_4159 [Bacillus licheniformis]TWM60340.1 hypothetical protein CHCC14810_0997 [Bacillus licheniformis]